jgi:hypothetical protein
MKDKIFGVGYSPPQHLVSKPHRQRTASFQKCTESDIPNMRNETLVNHTAVASNTASLLLIQMGELCGDSECLRVGRENVKHLHAD